MRLDPQKLLAIYSAVLTGAVALAITTGAAPHVTRFDEIDVKRINVREDDGTIRMTISNSSRAPGLIVRGKETPHPAGRKAAGILFFNQEGTENGGISFDGRRVDGKVIAGGQLAFDQYDQDQVIQIGQSESGGRRSAAMVVHDRPDMPINEFAELARRIAAMPAGPARDAELKRVQEAGLAGRQRLYVGKTREQASAVTLSDAMGRPRLLLKVAADGRATIDFLDEKGSTVRSIAP